ncbi:hypothetical protein L9F63_011050 [Diploptera punctata]|uniref:Uncharacterized protein n=1 Tax=Diploptera punctata TaxID=6984 RepID=A0AAD8EQE0_DIPPU|nr:hypothetical protein L9F63_011050 [Diploptera punctata]
MLNEESNKLRLLCDNNDQHMASDGEGSKDDSNSKLPEIDEQQKQSDQPEMKFGAEVCMDYGPKKRKYNSANYIFENKELIEKAMTKLAKEEDECGIFGRYVASVLRSLSSEALKRKLKKRIQQILLEMPDEDKLPDDILNTSGFSSCL